ncbi:hypothetical protein V6N12_075357 [Hibiscus sabdariffa]|uniref:Uncharacterized protein n=1 Tax=Hibiscus sabdariffa TaxID=183260 RepID=A0ABR2C7D5_9ROSI
MLVFLNKKDLVDDELLQLDKLEVRKLFCSYDFTDNDVPIVFGFALLASQALMVNPSTPRGVNEWVDKMFSKERYPKGMVLTKPRTINPYTMFRTILYLFGKKDGGDDSPFYVGYKSAQFCMSTINVIGKVTTIINDKVVIPRFPSSTMASVSSDPLAVEEKIMAREAVKLVLPWSTWLTWPTYDLARDESPDVNICTIGYVNHDKTSLTASPAMAFAYTTKRNRGYVHLDFCGHGDYVKYMITQDDRIDGAILLGSRADGSKA